MTSRYSSDVIQLKGNLVIDGSKGCHQMRTSDSGLLMHFLSVASRCLVLTFLKKINHAFLKNCLKCFLLTSKIFWQSDDQVKG